MIANILLWGGGGGGVHIFLIRVEWHIIRFRLVQRFRTFGCKASATKGPTEPQTLHCPYPV